MKITKKRLLGYAVPVLGLALLAGVGSASAHGFFGFGAADQRTPEQVGAQQQTMFQNEADLLGISVDEVKDAWANGTSIKDLAKTHGITDEQLQAKMKDALLAKEKAHLQTLVSQGIITQAQADKRLSALQNMPKRPFGRMGRGFK
jgi:hypothetical protein